MPEGTDYIEELIKVLLAPPMVGPINHDVYQPMLKPADPDGPAEPDPNGDWPCQPFTHRPRCVYFYYVRIDRDGKLAIDHYFYPNGPLDDPMQWQPINGTDINGIVAGLAQNARPRTPIKNPPKLPAHNFDNVDWNQICYIAIFVDEAHWKLHRRASSGLGAIVFNTLKGSTPNASFFDAKDFEVDMSVKQDGSDMRAAVSFINHMTADNAGNFKIEDKPDVKYVFDIYFDVEYAIPSTSTATLVFDPTGTNQGPPQKP